MFERKDKDKREENKISQYEYIRCHFETHGSRCRFVGVFGQHSEKSYCEFHSQTLANPKELNTHEMFVEWFSRWQRYFKLHECQFINKKQDTIWYMLGNE